MEDVTMTIRCEPLYQIAIGIKRIEYREIKPYWTNRLSRVKAPFHLRLINGMTSNAPKVTVLVEQVRKNSRSRNFELVLGKVLKVEHWSTLRKRANAARKTGPE